MGQFISKFVGYCPFYAQTSTNDARVVCGLRSLVSIVARTIFQQILTSFSANLHLLATAACYAQQPGATPAPAFETASIHPAKLTPGCFSMLPPGGVQYAVTCLTLRNFIEIAYGTSYIGGGGSALDEYYDFRATVPGDKSWNSSTIAPMMKQFLIESFHLAVHSGTRELSGYALVVGKSGSKLKATQADPTVQGQKAGESTANFTAPGYV